MAGPTPGPWTILNEEAATADHWTGRVPLEVGAGDNHIATFYSSDNAPISVTPGQALAHAKLFIAAREMLAALLASEEFHNPNAAAMRRAAIAKATGDA